MRRRLLSLLDPDRIYEFVVNVGTVVVVAVAIASVIAAIGVVVWVIVWPQ